MQYCYEYGDRAASVAEKARQNAEAAAQAGPSKVPKATPKPARSSSENHMVTSSKNPLAAISFARTVRLPPLGFVSSNRSICV